MESFIPNTPSMAIWAMVVACFLPLVFTWIAKLSGGFKSKDNVEPRKFLDKLTGMPARARAVEQNSYESLPMFLVAVVVAMLFFVPQSIINNLAWLYVAIRIAYGIAYLLNLSLFRSILWALSMACVFILFWTTARMAG